MTDPFKHPNVGLRLTVRPNGHLIHWVCKAWNEDGSNWYLEETGLYYTNAHKIFSGIIGPQYPKYKKDKK